MARHSLKEVTRRRQSGFTWKFDPAIWQHFSIGDTEMLLKATRCRIAVFRGEHSVLMPPEVGTYIFNLLGRAAPVVEIPEAQHHIMLDQPLALVAALRALLADWEHSTPHAHRSARMRRIARCTAGVLAIVRPLPSFGRFIWPRMALPHDSDTGSMDISQHQRAYAGFLTFAKWSLIGIVLIMIFLAIFRTHT